MPPRPNSEKKQEQVSDQDLVTLTVLSLPFTTSKPGFPRIIEAGDLLSGVPGFPLPSKYEVS
jgi:hypothetical protein